MEFTLIHPDGLRAAWPRIRAGLDRLPPEDWIAEDVYHAIKAGTAALYIGTNDTGYAGFFAFRLQQEEFSREPVLHVWLACNEGDADVFGQAEAFILHVAREAGARRMTFGSPRKGWAKRYQAISTTYSIPVAGAEAAS